MTRYLPLQIFISAVLIFSGGFFVGNAPALHPTEIYRFNDNEVVWCHETTTIDDGVARTSWHATTNNFYFSRWGEGPKTCEEFKKLFTRSVQ